MKHYAAMDHQPMIRSYSELIQLPSFAERLKYLQLFDEKYLSPRSLSPTFYKSLAWLSVRKEILIRDGYSDLGIRGLLIDSDIIVHHINPLEIQDIEEQNVDKLLDPENLICVSYETHNKIHYKKAEIELLQERSAGDTKLW